MRLKVFLPLPNEAWIGDQTSSEFQRFSRHEIIHDYARFDECDMTWMYSKWIANHFHKQKLASKPCITTIHHIVDSKGIDIDFFDSFTTVYHVPNRFTDDSLRSRTSKDTAILPYWIDLERWNDVRPLRNITFPCNSTVLGSFQRDTEGNSINSEPVPKLEKGPDLFVDIVRSLSPSETAILLGGWRRQWVVSKLSPHYNIHMKTPIGDTPTLSSTEIMQAYATLAAHNGYYLVTSRVEGGPQAIIEAAISGCRILSTTMGIAPDVLDERCLCGEADDPQTKDRFIAAILSEEIPWAEITEINRRNALKLDARTVINRYDDLAEKTYAAWKENNV